MSERLLSALQTSERLGISIRSFHRHKVKLMAQGLQAVAAGRRVVFREASLDRVIKTAADNEDILY